MSGDVVRVGIVGAGSWAALAHVPAVLANPHAELVGIADRDSVRLAETADHYGIAARFEDHQGLLDAGVDALIVVTPHSTHYPIARDALDAGAHLLIEKPLTVRAWEAHDLAERAAASGSHVVAGYTLNYSAGAAAARAAVQAGRLGELTLVSCLFSSPVEDLLRGLPGDQSPYVARGPSAETYSDPALAGGGQGQTQVTHVAEMLLWVTGERPRQVSAFMENRGAAVDVVDALAFRLRGGALGTIASTGGLRPGQAQQQELRYFGTEGVLLQDLLHDRVVLAPASGGEEELSPAIAESAPGEGGTYPTSAPLDNLVALIRGEDANGAPVEPAIATVELLEAAYRSAASGGQPIDVASLPGGP
jgi:predicted dehydrogenase